ncbi:cobamide remodeling phosphodiesterase CbiR [Megalodesulfovibrio paquesii]
MNHQLSAPPVPWPIAAPSWVLAGDVLENCRFLAGRVEEAGLCLFESAACLDYPASMWAVLAGLPLCYHLHLPLDLEEQTDPAAVCLALAQAAAPLAPWAVVIHPFADPARLGEVVAAWTAAGHAPGRLLLENIPTLPLETIVSLAYQYDLGICLDLGHLLLARNASAASDIAAPIPPAALARCRMLHLSCPESRGPGRPGHRHLPLDSLNPAETRLAEALLLGAPAARRMVEVFDWQGVQDSMRWLRARDRQPEGNA